MADALSTIKRLMNVALQHGKNQKEFMGILKLMRKRIELIEFRLRELEKKGSNNNGHN